jgi:putative ABC transport system permease protein
MFTTFRSASLDLGNGLFAEDPKLSELHLKVDSLAEIDPAIQQVREVLLQTHRGIEDFGFDTREDWAEDIESTIHSAKLNGSIIAGISLVVGGIGIANIMLASITERIREIGIRLAVGAHQKHVFSQILIESSLLGLLGGLMGILVSLGLVRLITQFVEFNYEPVVTLDKLVVSFVFSVLTGMLAGIYPALKASRLDPIQALRYE